MIQTKALILLLILLPSLLVLQRQLHREILSVFLLLTRRGDISIVLFSILFFPGILLHEMSHWLMAKALSVRTGRLSLLPRRLENGYLRLGSVETVRSDPFRESLIGAAPLLAGGLFVAYTGWFHLGVSEMWESVPQASWSAWADSFSTAISQPDFWLWFYLTFAVSSTMFPSSSDRRAWPSIMLVIGILIVLVIFSGAGPWLVANFSPVLDAAIQSISVILGISVIVHLALFVPFFLAYWGLSRITGLKVV